MDSVGRKRRQGMTGVTHICSMVTGVSVVSGGPCCFCLEPEVFTWAPPRGLSIQTGVSFTGWRLVPGANMGSRGRGMCTCRRKLLAFLTQLRIKHFHFRTSHLSRLTNYLKPSSLGLRFKGKENKLLLFTGWSSFEIAGGTRNSV